MHFPRTSGILVHPTSFPSAYGIGDLGREAFEFIDFLSDSGQHLWQVLPLGPTGYGDSPYQCLSAFAGNPLLISPEKLVEEGFLEDEDLKPVPRLAADHVNFGKVIEYKKRILDKAYERFRNTTDTSLRTDFLAFCQRAAAWLEEYALFRVLKDEHNGSSWDRWEPSYAQRDPAALSLISDLHRERIEAEKFVQYLFFKQYAALKNYCSQKQISIVGDMPIFVAYDSSDVWCHPEYFKLNETGTPTVVAGVPPDYFSATGQLWGNPIYDWDFMIKDNFSWWVNRISHALETTDIVRIDHFRGFAACWEIPYGDKTAQNGRWVETPGEEFFTVLIKAFPDVPIIVEDLGVITPDVEALRDGFGFPGMRILQMAFRSDACNIDLPHNYIPNSVVYTGTHDNDTIVGWFQSKPGEGSTRDAQQIESERKFCLRYLKSNGKEIHWDFIEAAFASVSGIAIVPLQDILGLGSKARMNLPASQEGNWLWRYKDGALTDELAARLKELTDLYSRNNAFTTASGARH